MQSHIRFDTDALELHLLDQRLLPMEESYCVCHNVAGVVRALQEMVVRGAPAIGVTAAWGCVLAVREAIFESHWSERLEALMESIAAARPTAVNLRWAVERMRRCRQQAADAEAGDLLELFMAEARAIQDEDVAACKAIGRFGADCLDDGDTVLTHCNAGALATAGYGTALGVIRGAVEQGKRIHVIADETRPFLQGARLTAWELQQDAIPVTVACDNACALLMHRGMIQKVVVGADRIAANGDAANKIGTYGVALLAHHFHIPFYVAAPLSTIDTVTPDGTAIPIEERPAQEVTCLTGQPVSPDGVPVYNFAFDVTPAQYISGIITEAGVLHAPYGPAIARALHEARTA